MSRTLSRPGWLAPIASLALLASGCPEGERPDDAASRLEGGPRVDARAGWDGESPSDLCATPRHVVLEVGARVSVSGELGSSPGGLELAAVCGAPEGGPRASEILALEVPGSGDVGIEVTLRGEPPDASSLIAEARSVCEAASSGLESCFDPHGGLVPGVTGFVAAGGSTVYLVVSGEGAYTAVFDTAPASAPVLDAAAARRLAGARLDLFASGTDEDADVVGVGIRLLAADGSPIPLRSDRPSELGPFFMAFDAPPAGRSFASVLASWSASPERDGIDLALGLRVFAYDRRGARSATREVRVEEASEVGFGEACDELHLCRASYACVSGACAASSALEGLCRSATRVVLEAPTDGAPTIRELGLTLGPGDGIIDRASCGSAHGAEAILAVEVPDGALDLLATTELEANPASLDTLVSVRSACVSDTSELACDDDASGLPGDRRSRVAIEDARSGTYYVVVDVASPLEVASSVAMALTLRPVLASGETCDAEARLGRCASGPCTSEGVCP